jgi:outer membrane lipoprotein-sorting protein
MMTSFDASDNSPDCPDLSGPRRRLSSVALVVSIIVARLPISRQEGASASTGPFAELVHNCDQFDTNQLPPPKPIVTISIPALNWPRVTMFGMRILSRPSLRWAAPLAIVLVVAGTGLVASTATAQPHLPPTTPEQLLVDLQNASVDNLSGSVDQEANLGIPEIPDTGGSDTSEFNSLLTGKHRLGVWFSDPDKARIALYRDLGESDVIRNGTDVWIWSSSENKATHRTVSPDERATPEPSEAPKTPQEAAQRILEAIGPTTELSIDSTVTVAGRPAYDLVARPKDERSLVTEARLAVDGETHLPLRAEVFAGDTTVFRVAYTEIDFAQPDPKVFEFTPPPGAEVTEVPAESTAPNSTPGERTPDQTDAPKVVGEGWTTVVVSKVPTGPDSGSDQADEQLRAFLQQLPRVSGSWGSGRLLSGTAFTAVVTDDGRLAIGSVPPELLYAALEK